MAFLMSVGYIHTHLLCLMMVWLKLMSIQQENSFEISNCNVSKLFENCYPG